MCVCVPECVRMCVHLSDTCAHLSCEEVSKLTSSV